jgi:hypothetical protein
VAGGNATTVVAEEVLAVVEAHAVPKPALPQEYERSPAETDGPPD